MSRAVVVGGGIAGLLAALQLRTHFNEVVLIEQGEKVGGLMRSWRNEDGQWFDFGTHVPGYTGVQGLDDLLFAPLGEPEWRQFTRLKTGNYFAGRYNPDNQFINTTALPPELHARGLVDLLAIRPLAERQPATLFEQLYYAYGGTYTEQIFRPLMRKIYNQGLEELAPGAHHPFGHSRLIVADAAASRELKRSPLYDSKLSYVSYDEVPESARYLYPRQGGVGKLVDALCARLEAKNIRVQTAVRLAGVACSDSRIQSLDLQGGEKIALDHLVWTVPPIALLRAAGVKSASSPPSFVPMSLHHLVFDGPPRVDNHFFNCNDPGMHAFRGTLYSNLRQVSSDEPRHCITIEAVDHQKTDIDEIGNRVVRELVQMDVFNSNAKLISRNSLPVPAGFPVLTIPLVNAIASQRETAKSLGDNLSLLGKASGGSFYMRDVLVETYQHIAERFTGN